MSYLKFDKSELVNLEYSLLREVLYTNKAGGYLNTTIVGCNTRKYHGLMVLPIENFDWKRHILLSSMDETLIQHGQEFNLGIRCYGKDKYDPRGHKYIVDAECDKYPVITYRVGGIRFCKSLIFSHNKEQLLIKYTLLEAHSSTILRLRPLLAFREIHALTHANQIASAQYRSVEGGAAFCMYDGFPTLNIQIDKPNDYFHAPAWYYNVSYKEEQRRGFEYQEDLFNPGYFELPITKGESVIVSVSTRKEEVGKLSLQFETQSEQRESVKSYEDCLSHAAKQFIVNRKDEKEIFAGYTWMGKGLRETLISLPGLTLFNDGDVKSFDEILESTYRVYDRQLMHGSKQAEAALWLFWVAQQYAHYTGERKKSWEKFGERLKALYRSYLSGERMGVTVMESSGLLRAKMNGVAMSWMDAYAEGGHPVTERGGMQVELNAFWYNAICYLLDMEESYGDDKRLIFSLRDMKERIENSFFTTFWSEERRHLADYVDETGQHIDTRPNQIFACALEYSPVSEEIRGEVMEAVRRELLTTRGIRTLSPKNPNYKDVYDGDQHRRDMAYHQGTTRVWLLSFYIEAMLKLYGEIFIGRAEELFAAFEEDISIHGVGSVCELYDGNPPHYPHGAISSAVAVAGLLRADKLIKDFIKGKEDKL